MLISLLYFKPFQFNLFLKKGFLFNFVIIICMYVDNTKKKKTFWYSQFDLSRWPDFYSILKFTIQKNHAYCYYRNFMFFFIFCYNFNNIISVSILHEMWKMSCNLIMSILMQFIYFHLLTSTCCFSMLFLLLLLFVLSFVFLLLIKYSAENSYMFVGINMWL